MSAESDSWTEVAGFFLFMVLLVGAGFLFGMEYAAEQVPEQPEMGDIGEGEYGDAVVVTRRDSTYERSVGVVFPSENLSVMCSVDYRDEVAVAADAAGDARVFKFGNRTSCSVLPGHRADVAWDDEEFENYNTYQRAMRQYRAGNVTEVGNETYE